MKRQEAIRVLTGRLRSSRVRHSAGFDSGQMQITMGFNAVYAPDHRIESCIWFYEDTMEARCYYSSLGAELCRKSRHIDALLRLLNFINARVFPSCRGSGYMLYSPHILYTPRIYLTADGRFDITITTIIPYDFFGLAPLETLDYMLPGTAGSAGSPDLLRAAGQRDRGWCHLTHRKGVPENVMSCRRVSEQHAAAHICDRRHRSGKALVHPAESPRKRI